MRHILSLLTVAAALLLAPACEEPLTACEAAAEHEPSLEVGTGEESFTAVENGHEVPVTWGAQGGQHVWMAVRTTGVAPGLHRSFGEDEPGPQVRFTLLGNGVDEVGWGDSYEIPMEGDASDAELLGQYLYLDWIEEGVYEFYVLRVEVDDECGTSLTEEREVVLPL